MVNEIRVYFEGDKALTPGFNAFFSEIRRLARAKACGFQLIATGSDWHRYFSKAIKSHPTSWNILLVDSDCPDRSDLGTELCGKNGWDRIYAASIFWMVEMMESWFHAHKEAIGEYYGNGFKKNALAANPLVEKIPKKDLENGLKNATRDTLKGAYHKTAHAPKLLERIDPGRVQKAAPNCRRLFEALEKELS